MILLPVSVLYFHCLGAVYSLSRSVSRQSLRRTSIRATFHIVKCVFLSFVAVVLDFYLSVSVFL